MGSGQREWEGKAGARHDGVGRWRRGWYGKAIAPPCTGAKGLGEQKEWLVPNRPGGKGKRGRES